MTAANRCNRWPQEGIHQQSTALGGENKTKKHETFASFSGMRKEKQKKTINSRINF